LDDSSPLDDSDYPSIPSSFARISLFYISSGTLSYVTGLVSSYGAGVDYSYDSGVDYY